MKAKFTHENLKELTSKLREFGLDPFDWKITPIGANTVRIISQHDEEFKFIGRYLKKGASIKWDYISLSGI